MHRCGDDDDGFSVTSDKAASVVLVQAWGFWGAPIAEAFAGSVEQECRGSGIPSRAIVLSLAAAQLKPQREVGEAAFRALFALVSKLGITRISVTTNALTKLQILRIGKEESVRGLIEFTNTGGHPGNAR
jgi:hypothetical protein